MKKLQVQTFCAKGGALVSLLIFFLFLTGCGGYPRLNECPKIEDKPSLDFNDVNHEISEMKNEINQHQREIGTSDPTV